MRAIAIAIAGVLAACSSVPTAAPTEPAPPAPAPPTAREPAPPAGAHTRHPR